MINFYNI